MIFILSYFIINFIIIRVGFIIILNIIILNIIILFRVTIRIIVVLLLIGFGGIALSNGINSWGKNKYGENEWREINKAVQENDNRKKYNNYMIECPMCHSKNVKKISDYLSNNNLSNGLIAVNNLNNIDNNLLMTINENSKLIVFEEIISNNNLANDLKNNSIIIKKNIKVFSYSLPNTYLVNGTEEEILNYYNLEISKILKEEE